MQITKNFTLEEMYDSETARAKKINNQPNAQQQDNLIRLVSNVLQPIRDKFGKPIYVNSGYRCEALNKAVGGVKTSEHLTGNAADINSSDNKALWKLITDMINAGEIKLGQCIWEKGTNAPTWIHLSNPSAKHNNEIFRL